MSLSTRSELGGLAVARVLLQKFKSAERTLFSMQQRMELFEGVLPEWLQHRYNYGFNIYDFGRVLHTASDGRGFFETVYHGIHNLDVSAEVCVPHEMLLAMNVDEILVLYAGAWLTKMDATAWNKAVNKRNVWDVVGAVFRTVHARRGYAAGMLRRISSSNVKAYSAVKGELRRRLAGLPQSTATQFMTAFTYKFQAVGAHAGYVGVNRLERGLDEVVFSHFAGKFADGGLEFPLLRIR